MHSESIADPNELNDTESLSNIDHGFYSSMAAPPSPTPLSNLTRDLQKSGLAASSDKRPNHPFFLHPAYLSTSIEYKML